MEIVTGDCCRNQEIPFLFYPDISGVSGDFDCNLVSLSFSLCIKVLFTNKFYCIKYVPIRFTW